MEAARALADLVEVSPQIEAAAIVDGDGSVAGSSGGEVFAVTSADGRAIVAVAGERSAPGLVFYDLKRCLAAAQEGDGVGT